MSQGTQLKILAAFPAYNKEQCIGSLVIMARQYTDEVLVVDDGSTDNTARIAELAGASVIRHGVNLGKGAAIQSIIIEAREKNPDALVLLDADFQHNPDDIPSIVEPLSRGFDIVVGSRMRDRQNIPNYRRFGQRTLSILSHILSGRRVVDSESGFRALSNKTLTNMELKQNGFAVEAEMLSEATRKGLRIAESPISAVYVKNGSTLNPIRHGVGVLLNILAMISERRPLFFFGLGGMIVTILGLIAAGKVLTTFAAVRVIAMGTAFLAAIFLIVGILAMFTGIILSTIIRRNR